jgi:hypothetical protein
MVHRNASVPKYTIPKSKPEWPLEWNLQVRCCMIWCMPLWHPTDHLARFQLDLVTSWQSLGVHRMIQWRLKWPPKRCVVWFDVPFVAPNRSSSKVSTWLSHKLTKFRSTPYDPMETQVASQVLCVVWFGVPLWHPTDHLARFQLDLVTSWQSFGVHCMIWWRLCDSPLDRPLGQAWLCDKFA